MMVVDELSVTPRLTGRTLDLSWRNPPASEFDGAPPFGGVRIVRRERSFARAPDDGDVVFDGPVISEFTDTDLQPLTSYYYTVFTFDNAVPSNFRAGQGSTATGFATEDYGLPERLYGLLPAVHKNFDKAADEQQLAATNSQLLQALRDLPPQFRDRGPLYRFLHTVAPFDLVRSFGEGLHDLRDLNVMRPEYLPPAANWLGWDLDRTREVYEQRSEIRFAPQLYRNVGTVRSMRQLVNHYTGWHVQAAEFEQHIVRSNLPARLNVFAIAEGAGGWIAPDDAAAMLGFGAGNDSASGTPVTSAVLGGSTTEPFALTRGMTFSATTDNRIPQTIVFNPADFADIGSATAAEVAGVVNAEFSELTARARIDGSIELQSNTSGANSALDIPRSAVSPITIQGSPRGRLATFVDTAAGFDRQRLFFDIADPGLAVTEHHARQRMNGKPPATGLANIAPATQPNDISVNPVELPLSPIGRVYFQTLRNNLWSDPIPVTDATSSASGEPAATVLNDGRILLLSVSNPGAADATLRWRTGEPRIPQPARLTGDKSLPTAITPGSRLTLCGRWGDPQVIEFAAADFADPSQASAVEVVAAMNARLSDVSATVLPDDTISIETDNANGDEFLEIDFSISTAAGSLGFFTHNGSADGSWGDDIDWSDAEDLPSAAPGHHAEPVAITDADGTVWVFWATHIDRRWQIVASRWDGVSWSALETLSTGIGSNREPFAVLDDTDRIWLFWAHQNTPGDPADLWELRRRTFDPTTSIWSAEDALTTPATAKDREPAAVRLPGGDLRVFFRTSRDGGSNLWETTITPATSATTPPVAVTTDHNADRWPAPFAGPSGDLLLLYRSDRSIDTSRLITRPQTEPDTRINSSVAAAAKRKPLASTSARSNGTLKRQCGTLSVDLSDDARIARRRRWDDLLSYTPQRPAGNAIDDALADDELYTRGTVGLYLSQSVPSSPLSSERIERLRPVLQKMLPINVRAVLILAPRVDIEFVYTQDADIGESYFDNHPFIENYEGLDDEAQAALPEWAFLLTNSLSDLSADPTSPITLQRRSYFEPPE